MLLKMSNLLAAAGHPHLSLVTAPAWAVGRWNPEIQDVWEAYVFRASLRGFGGLAMRRLKTCFAGEVGMLPVKSGLPAPAGPPDLNVIESRGD